MPGGLVYQNEYVELDRVVNFSDVDGDVSVVVVYAPGALLPDYHG